MIRRLLTAGLVLAVLLPATWVLGGAMEGQNAAQTAGPADTLTGQVMTPEPVSVIAPVGGAIVAVFVEEGDVVQAGDVLAQLAHDETKLLAPVAGVVTRRSVNRGSVVRPDGAAPFQITPQTPLRLVVEVDAATSRSLRSSSTAAFTLSGDKRAFKALFSEVRAEPNGSGSLRYLASFSTEGSAAPIRAGMTVSVQLRR